MTAHFINVGQGDATLLEFPCGAVLIDAGGQDEDSEANLINYLRAFFERRTDLNNTIDLVIITHPHIDHNRALREVVNNFTVKKYIDNGIRRVAPPGSTNQIWLQRNSRNLGIKYATYSYEKIIRGGNIAGLSDTIIDPIDCADVNPEIILMSGRFTRQRAAWSNDDYKNPNNHSVVVKVVFGASSFLFTGDLEEAGIRQIIKTYDGALDVDVVRVGHHGSHNATTVEYLEEITPTHAVISCGRWDFGRGSSAIFTTFRFGHPRISILNMLADSIEEERSNSITVKAAHGSMNFVDFTITKMIFATPWDNNIQIEADSEGTYRVISDQ